MISQYLRRGIAVGTVAGTILAGYLTVVLWLPMHHTDTGAHHHPADSALTLSTMIDIGSGMLWGALLGSVFAFVFFIFEGSLPGSARLTTSCPIESATFYHGYVLTWPQFNRCEVISARLITSTKSAVVSTSRYLPFTV